MVSGSWSVTSKNKTESANFLPPPPGSLARAFTMLARSRIQATVGKPQPLDRFPANNVRFDDLVNVGFGDIAVPDGFWINHNIRPVLALIEAARLVGPYSAFEPAFGQFLFE